MNPFYDISINEQLADEEFSLHNLGSQKIFATIGKRRSDYWGSNGTQSTHHYTPVLAEDYDKLFIYKIGKWKPIYDIEKLIEHHFYHFLKKQPDGKEEFLKHMRYVILPILKRQKNRDSDTRIELFEQWLNEKLVPISPIKSQTIFQNSDKISNTQSKKTIFISYSHSDEKYKNEVVKTLKGLEYVFPNMKFDVWSDERIRTGQKWLDEIEQALQKANIAIMILSRDFIASDFIMKKEVPALLLNAKEKGTIIINLVAGKSLFKDSLLSEFQCVNDPNKPLKGMDEHQQDEVYTKLAEDVRFYLSK